MAQTLQKQQHMWLQLDAYDTLFFRNGKPFSMGEDSAAQSFFPPAPSVMYGALLSTRFEQKGQAYSDNLLEEYRKEVAIKSFQLAILGDKITPLYPAPADLVRKKGALSDELHLLQLEPAGKCHNGLCSYLLTFSEMAEAVSDGWLCSENFIKYLEGNSEQTFKYLPKKELVATEAKIGIGRDIATGSSKEGQLYRVGMQRPLNILGEQLGFLLQCNDGGQKNFPLADEASMRIGAEGKAMHYIIIEDAPVIPPPPDASQAYLKLYLATPTVFNDGIMPFSQKLGGHIYERQWNGVDVEISAYACGKAQPLGGWDIKEGRPKPMVKAVPAGAVYYLRIDDDARRKDFINAVHGQSISDYFDTQGFGIAWLGPYSPVSST